MYAPSYENEVVLLFGMLLSHLNEKFVIDEYPGSFPDCIAKWNGKDVGIEFEVNLSDFFAHHHDLDPDISKCNLIICWKNDRGVDKLEIGNQKIEVRELSRWLTKIREEKGLAFVLKPDEPKYPPRDQWSKDDFFKQLSQSVDDEKYRLVDALYKFTESNPQFQVDFGRGHRIPSCMIRRKGMTGAVPVGVEATGRAWVDYRGMPEDIRNEFRRKIDGQKGKLWHPIILKDQKTLDMIKEALKWLAENL